ncbi:hypothetical protein OROGR_028539 [Orobanche gracilis]
MDCCKNSKTIMGQVVCPKPRRVGPSNLSSPSMAAPLRHRICDEAESKTGAELLGVIFKEDFQANLSSSPPFFFGSPPCRAPNPLVQDARFGVEKANFILKSPAESGSPQAVLRVEGFDCPSTRAVAMA